MRGRLRPVFSDLALIQVLFVIVSLPGKEAVRAGAGPNGFAWGREPERSRRWAHNLHNQLQPPVPFCALVTKISATGVGGRLEAAPAWLFPLGRFARSWVQTSGDDVRLRGRAFTFNDLPLSAMWLVRLARMAFTA